MPEWPTFTCSYKFEDGEWGITIPAQSFEEARRRIRAIGLTGKVDGELHVVIPATPGVGLTVRLSCWMRNIASAFK